MSNGQWVVLCVGAALILVELYPAAKKLVAYLKGRKDQR